MNKALCIAVLLAGTFALTGPNSAASPTTPDYPQIVAKGKLLGETEPISVVAFTPAQDGVYRISAYATVIHADPTSSSDWTYSTSWTDELGPETLGGLTYQSGKNPGQFLNIISEPEGGSVTTIHAKANTSITINLTQSGPHDASVVNAYYIVEQLM